MCDREVVAQCGVGFCCFLECCSAIAFRESLVIHEPCGVSLFGGFAEVLSMIAVRWLVEHAELVLRIDLAPDCLGLPAFGQLVCLHPGHEVPVNGGKRRFCERIVVEANFDVLQVWSGVPVQEFRGVESCVPRLVIGELHLTSRHPLCAIGIVCV